MFRRRILAAAAAAFAVVPAGVAPASPGDSQPPDLRVALTASSSAPTVGAQLVYSVEVSSVNAQTATGIELLFRLPQGVQYLGAEVTRGPGCTPPRQGELHCALAWPSAPLVDRVTVWTRVAAPGDLVAAASVRAAQEDAVPADNAATLTLTASPAAGGVAGAHISLRVRLFGRARVGQLLIAQAAGDAGQTSYRWEICRRGSCSALPGVRTSFVRIRSAWAGARLRVVARDGGLRALATTSRIRGSGGAAG